MSVDYGETQLAERLATIEAVHAGGGDDARERIRARLLESTEPAIEMGFSIHDPWARRLFCALARRYGLIPYRERGQRRTSIMLKVPRSFVDVTLWPEYQELSAALHGYLEIVTTRVIAKAIHENGSEEAEATSEARV